MAAAELVPITERIAACRDPTDDKFLELAVNGHADLIVTGDARSTGAQSVPGYPDRHAGDLRPGRGAITVMGKNSRMEQGRGLGSALLRDAVRG